MHNIYDWIKKWKIALAVIFDPKVLYDGSEHDNGDDACNDGNVENECLVNFLHDNESFFF